MTVEQLTESSPDVFEISADPATGALRKAWAYGFDYDYRQRHVIFKVMVIPYQVVEVEGVETEQVIETRGFRPFLREMKADDTTKVDGATGIICQNIGTEAEPQWVNMQGQPVPAVNIVGQFTFMYAGVLPRLVIAGFSVVEGVPDTPLRAFFKAIIDMGTVGGSWE